MTPLLQENQHYTYANYIQWDDDQHWELIDGTAYAMAPPSTAHQRISRQISLQLGNFLKGKPCELFTAPFGVRLQADAADDAVVLPDLVVICDRSKIDKWGCNGAPDFIIEILSPSTARHDCIIKMRAYQQAGVKEYWIVDPDTKSVQVCVLMGEHYLMKGYTQTDIIAVSVLAGCKIALQEIFSDT